MKVDRHVLYEAAVQGVEYDLDMFARMYRTLRRGRLRVLREDFCGTAALAAGWVRRSGDHRAYGVDLDPRVLAWARKHRVSRMGEAARRLTLVQADVRATGCPPVDMVCAMNFSYWVFKRRKELIHYFRSVRRSLGPRGLFVCNAYGGTDAMDRTIESTRIPTTLSPEGVRVPAFTYVWEQTRFNPITHHLRCSIHFRLRDGREIRRAFHYDWRFWTLPELSDALLEAGFREVAFWIDAWDDETGEPADHYRRSISFENQLSWIACLVAIK